MNIKQLKKLMSLYPSDTKIKDIPQEVIKEVKKWIK